MGNSAAKQAARGLGKGAVGYADGFLQDHGIEASDELKEKAAEEITQYAEKAASGCCGGGGGGNSKAAKKANKVKVKPSKVAPAQAKSSKPAKKKKK